LQKPKTLEEAVDKLVALRLEAEREMLTQRYATQEEALQARVAQLEAAAAAAAAAAATPVHEKGAKGKK